MRRTRSRARRRRRPSGGGAMRSTCSVCSRRLSARSTRKRKPSSVVVSPRLGSRPNAFSTRPPTVSNSSSSNVRAELRVEVARSRSAPSRGSGRCASGMMLSSLSSKSYSSSMSPTICSSTSSIVTRPDTPPYSSTTIAMWLRLARNSRSSTLRRFDSGTNTAGRSISRSVELLRVRVVAQQLLGEQDADRRRPCSRRSPGSASASSRRSAG